MNSIDINCDMGESFGHFQIGNDEAIFPLITSSNIACGFHGGDPLHMEQTIKLAIEHGVQIGAHPGFPDLAGFGRRKMELSQEELKANVKYQLAAIKGMAESLGTSVVYVKPHGALYNLAADSEEVSNTLIAGVMEIDQNLMIMGLAGSLFQEICLAQNLPFIAEAFADRCYQANGRLRSRSLDHSVITDPKQAAQQVLDLVANQQVTTFDGTVISLEAQSICVHGDNDKAVEILMSIDEVLTANRIQKRSFYES